MNSFINYTELLYKGMVLIKEERTMKNINVGVITLPIGKAGNVPLSNLIDILKPLSKDIHLITGDAGYDYFKRKKIYVYEIQHRRGENSFTRIIKYAAMQLRLSYMVAKITRKGAIDTWILFIGGRCLLLPTLTAKLLRKKVVLAFAGDIDVSGSTCIVIHAVKILSNTNCTLANHIILYSPSLIKEWNLEKYKDKISIAHKHFLDFDKFKVKKKFDERDNLVGYIGRLSEEKGILNFVKAIPEVIKESDDIKFLIGGDGELQGEIEKYLDGESLNDRVKLAGWITHKKLPDYLNELKLVVLPSYTEGLPNLMLEAMACGTPVLATPVGGIPDVITDGETGFIMENNSPVCIAENVMRALEPPDLEGIVENARALVERGFTYEAAVERYRTILEEL